MWVRLVAAVAAIGVVAGGAWWLIGPGADPGLVACDDAERADVPVVPVVFEPTISWEPAALPANATDPDEQLMLAVSPLGHGWVAAGVSSSGPETRAMMLHTTDGVTWGTEPDEAPRFSDAEVDLLAEVDDRRVVASGTISAGSPSTGAWVARGGAAWDAADGPFDASRPTAIAAGNGGLLLLGAVEPGGAPVAWTSPTGSRWERVELRLPVEPAHAAFAAVRPDDGGWLGTGSLSRGVDAAAWPVIWASADGATWSCRLLDRAGFDVAQPMQLHRSAQGWLVVGTAGDVCGFGASCVGHAIAWTSPDGVRWSAGRLDEPWLSGGVAYAGSSEGFVAVGHGTTWWSADGNAWVEIADGGTGPGALIGQLDALAMTDDGRLAAVGTTHNGTDADAWIAIGFLAR
jgi:hypothetical protein